MTHKANTTDGAKGKLKVAVLAAGTTRGVPGGAERFYQGLVEGVAAIGCQAELVSIPADEPSFEAILNNYDNCRSLDLSSYDVVISTKAPTYAIEHPRHVLYLVHTVRVFDDMFYESFPSPTQEQYLQRSKLFELDFAAMSKIKARFAIGHEVANRLYRWKGLKAEVIHPPLGIEGFRPGITGDYFFLPGRLHRWKRVDLIIDAIKRSSLRLRLIVAGIGEAEADLKLRAENDPRIEFLGRISDEQLIELYSGALAIPFAPAQEDYGYVTLEAFSSAKAVVTCSDSGEPTQFVKNGETGLVCEPTAESVQHALEWLFIHPERADEMGRNGAKLIAGMSWSSVARRLIDACLAQHPMPTEKSTKISVIDMQPIDPPVGGGRLRLLGLYHNLGCNLSCTYLGSYDWTGEKYRRHRLSPCLEEIDVPLSDEHHAAARALAFQAGGKTVIDIAFGRLGFLSEEYLNAARKVVGEGDVVVFSHPWVYPLLKHDITHQQIVIYDSHNVEGFLRAQLLNEENPCEAALLRSVIDDEYQLGLRSDLILACSQEDLARFHRLYNFPAAKMRVVPNGVLAFKQELPGISDKKNAREILGIDRWGTVAIFLASAYGPNVGAADFIIEKLAPKISDVLFVIAGGIGDNLKSEHSNVLITGSIDETQKYHWLSAADIAVNPMFSGSGTNIKMFDFMAMCLPTITTAVGARGIDTAGREALLIVESTPEEFIKAFEQLSNLERRQQIGLQARACVEDGYAWERISDLAGRLFQARHRYDAQPLPTFSVVIPTYERHSQLDALISRLQRQVERDFEVVIVDQSASRWHGADREYGFPFVYFQSPVKGAVRARNTGAYLAQGSIIAFTDDDCLPYENWLFSAREYFSDRDVVGVEGLIISDHLNDPKWRPVTNVGFEGIGFMTANFLVRAECFQLLGGFDLVFDRPHFREDTDFGWRLQGLGKVPYGKDVVVFHPAQSRDDHRESSAERGRFFEKDALLYKKHPDKYRELFFLEKHFQHTPEFIHNLRNGFQSCGISPPSWMKPHLEA